MLGPTSGLDMAVLRFIKFLTRDDRHVQIFVRRARDRARVPLLRRMNVKFGTPAPVNRERTDSCAEDRVEIARMFSIVPVFLDAAIFWKNGIHWCILMFR